MPPSVQADGWEQIADRALEWAVQHARAADTVSA
jgi:hypothetical protein